MNDFLKDLKEVLEKHKGAIGFSVDPCSDTYGLYDDQIVITQNNKTILEVGDWWLTDGDIQ